MIVGKAIYYLLTNATGVTDIVSTRIYPEIAQQDADLPYIVYAIANNEPTDTKPEPSKLDTAQVEINIYSTSYTECIDLAVAVRAALDRVKGTYNGVNVQSIQYLNEVIDFDEPQRAYNINADYDVRISRSGFEIAQGSPITGVQLGELSDVDVTGVTNGQLIAYNSTSGNWEAANDAGGAESLNDLTDVNITLPEPRNVLMYDGEEWVEDNVSKSDIGLGNVDNTSDADKPVSTATQTALNAKADTSAVPTELNDLSDVTITGTPTGNQALIYDGTAGAFKSLPNFTNRFEDEAEINKQGITPFAERVYTVKADGDGIFIDPESDTPTAGKVIVRKIYQKAGFLESGAVIGDFTLIHTFADDTAYSATTSTFEGFRDGDTYGTPPFTLIQTWEEQTAAPAFTGLLNESYGSGAAAAYSVRRLNGNYTGAAIQVERSSDNTTQDIGFDSNGDLDESALSTFCSGTVCKVRTWYGQEASGGTGSGNDAVQTDHTKQPTIYTGGAIVKENGRVAVDFDGSSDTFATTYQPQLGTASTADLFTFTVSSQASSHTGTIWRASDGNSRVVFNRWNALSFQSLYRDNNNINVNAASSALATNQQYLLAGTLVNGTVTNYVDGTTSGTSSGSFTGNIDLAAPFYIGSSGGSTERLNGNLQELVFYSSDKSTDRTSIESNIGDYFTQNTPLLDTYTGAAAAYSLRKLRSAYSGSAIRVRRASDNTEQDINFNVFGELDTVSLASFCSGTNGFVKVWYDQSGSANDATQTNTGNQPKIYDSVTGVVTQGGKPTLKRNASGSIYMNTPSLGSTSSIASIFTIVTPRTNRSVIYQSGGYIASEGNGALAIYYGSFISGTASTIQQRMQTYLIGSTDYGYIDGTLNVSGDAGSNVIGGASNIGGQSPNFRDPEEMQEIIIYLNDQSSNRTNIESNIATFYGITL